MVIRLDDAHLEIAMKIFKLKEIAVTLFPG